MHLGTDADLWHAAAAHVGWAADVNTRMNTVSSVDLDVYARPGELPILPWNDDLMIRLSFGATL